MSFWSFDNIINTPAAGYSGLNRCVFQPKYFSPFGHWFGLTFIGKGFGVAPVSGLGSSFCPQTVVGRVSDFVVFSFNGEGFCWSFSHVFEEFRKRFFPSFTHLDSTTPVIRIINSVFVVTSRFYSCPDSIFRCFTETVGFVGFRGSLLLKTSATFATIRSKVCGCVKGFVSAITKAFPKRGRSFSSNVFHNDKTIESLTNKVCSFHYFNPCVNNCIIDFTY